MPLYRDGLSRRELNRGRRLALDPEPDTDVRVILLDLLAVDRGGGFQNVHPLDPSQGLGRLGERLRRRVAPGLGGDADQIDRLDDGQFHSSCWIECAKPSLQEAEL